MYMLWHGCVYGIHYYLLLCFYLFMLCLSHKVIPHIPIRHKSFGGTAKTSGIYCKKLTQFKAETRQKKERRLASGLISSAGNLQKPRNMSNEEISSNKIVTRHNKWGCDTKVPEVFEKLARIYLWINYYKNAEPPFRVTE